MTTPAAWHPDPVGEASWRWWDGNAWSGRVAPAREIPELAPVASSVGKSLKLDQEFGAGTDALRCEDRTVGLMHKPSLREVVAETTAGAWRFDRQGVVTGKAAVEVQPAGQEIGLFEWDGVGPGTDGTLRFPDGRWFRLTRAKQLAQEQVVSPADYDPAHAVWVWYDPYRSPFMTVRLAAPPPKTKTIFGREVEYTSSWSGTGKTGMDIWIDMHEAAASVRELPMLTMLGTFLIWWTTTMRESVHREARSKI